MKVFQKSLNFIILILLTAVQIVLAEHLKLYGITMDIILVAVIALSLKEGLYYGIFYGFAAGLIYDLLTKHIVGVSSLLYFLSVFIVIKLMEQGFKKITLSYVFIVFVVSEFNIILFNLIYYLFNFNINTAAFGLEILIKPAFNIVLIFLIFPLLKTPIFKEDYLEYKYNKKT